MSGFPPLDSTPPSPVKHRFLHGWQTNSVHILPAYFCKIPCNIIHRPCLGLRSHLFLSGFPTKIPYIFLFSPTHCTCPCISFCLIWSLGKYISWSSSLHHLPESPVIPSLLHPHICTLCLYIFSPHSLFKVSGQVSRYKSILLWYDKRAFFMDEASFSQPGRHK